MSARWQLRLLGGFELSDGRITLHKLPSRAALLILARLALAPQREHPREELIDLLWPDVALHVGRNRLRQALSTLRGVLEPGGGAVGPIILADRHALRLASGAVASDVEALRRALSEGDTLRAQDLARGELLPGHFDEWVLIERRQLEQALVRLQETAPTGVVATLARTLAPGPTHWLPAYLTRMLGYEEAGAELAASVQAHRLVLLRGPGGAGKTRLAVEVARALATGAAGVAAPFDAVVFVPLVGVTSAEASAEAVQRALRSQPGTGDVSTQLEQALAGRRVLLVLDNFEQLVEVARELLARWLARLPLLHLLVTSRRVLGLDGEHEIALAALALPEPDATLNAHALNPAVALFVDRARAVRASFSLHQGNHVQVAAVVLLLQGLPLAIELAAARVRSIALSDMRAMLEAAVAGQADAAFTLLSRSGPRAGEDLRHASMQHVMAWSFGQLSGAARALLDALSVCCDGAGLPAAAAMAGLPLHEAALQLDELVASSVVYTQQRASQGEEARTRYHPFEPVREYALMQLAATRKSALRRAHWRCMQAWTHSLGHAPHLSAFGDDEANLMAAWAHAADTAQHEALWRSVFACAAVLDDVTLSSSALALLQKSLAALRCDAELLARAHALLAEQCFESGQRDVALAYAEQALQGMPAASPFRADALRVAARIRLRVRNDVQSVGALVDDALVLAAAQGRRDLQARLLNLKGTLLVRRDRDFAGKVELDTQALALWRAHGAPQRVTEGLVDLALALGFVHRVPEQLALLEQARDAAAALGQQRLHAFACSVTGYALADLQRWEASAVSYRSCLISSWAHSAWREWFYALWNLPRTLAYQRRPEAATLLLAFADRFASERFGELGWSDLRERRRTRRLVRAQVGVELEAAWWERGRALSMAEAMRLANGIG